MHKNIKLLIVLIAQVVLISVLFVVNSSSSGVDYEPKLFTVADTASISKIELTKAGKTVELANTNGQWLVNNDFDADNALIRVIKSVLNRVEVLRPVSTKINSEIVQQVMENGVAVKLYDAELLKTFYVGGNQNKTISYFVHNNKAYRVGVPGYNDYLSAIFGLTPIQWKERTIFSSSWRSVNKIDVKFRYQDDFSILFANNDLSVVGVEPLDSANMMNYIYQFDRFLVNEYVEKGQFKRYDSLAQTTPEATLEITDIDESKNLKINVFPALPNEGFHLVTDNKGRMMMIDLRRISQLFPNKQVFYKEEESSSQNPFGSSR